MTGGHSFRPSENDLKRTGLLVFLALAAACSKGEGTYIVGAAGPWKESYGVMSRRGIDLAVDQINAAGGINGSRLRLVARDDEANATRATAIAEEFVREPVVLAVIGHVNSGA